MGYVVNENRQTSSALVHDESCGCYAQRQLENPRDGEWLGPFESKDEAVAEASAAGHSEVKAADCCLSGTGIIDKAKGIVDSAKEGVRRSAEVLSGADIRRFEEFTDAVTTAVMGVHRDQTELRERTADAERLIDEQRREQEALSRRLSHLERLTQTRPQESKFSSLSPWVIAFGTISVMALLLSVIAVVMAIS